MIVLVNAYGERILISQQLFAFIAAALKLRRAWAVKTTREWQVGRAPAGV